jgi:hypothetical protein
MNPKHHLFTQGCFGMAGSIQILWIGPFRVLLCYVDCVCDAAFQGQIPCTHNLVHISSELFEPFCLLQYLHLARLKGPHGFRT